MSVCGGSKINRATGPRGIEDIWQVSASPFRFVIYGNLSISSLSSLKMYKDAQCPSHQGGALLAGVEDPSESGLIYLTNFMSPKCSS